MCCSVLSRETYNALTKWLTDARTLASHNIAIILCGNKKDLDADREVTFLEASRFAQENGETIQNSLTTYEITLYGNGFILSFWAKFHGSAYRKYRIGAYGSRDFSG